MKSKMIKWPVGLRISTPKRNEILGTALALKLKPLIECDSSLYGEHLFGLQEFFFKEEGSISFELFIGKIKSLNGVGRPVWSYLWDESGIHIPEAWKSYILYFGEIFENEKGEKFLLSFFFLEKWEFVFEEINENYIPNQGAMLVCLV